LKSLPAGISSGLTNEISDLVRIDQRTGASSLSAVQRQPTHVPMAPSVTSTGIARITLIGSLHPTAKAAG
jgi:hypothetical protein